MNDVKAADVKRFMISHLADSLKFANVDGAEVTDDFDLMKAGVIDSFGLIELVSAIEEHFSISLDLENLDTDQITIIGPLSKYVETQTGAGQGHA